MKLKFYFIPETLVLFLWLDPLVLFKEDISRACLKNKIEIPDVIETSNEILKDKFEFTYEYIVKINIKNNYINNFGFGYETEPNMNTLLIDNFTPLSKNILEKNINESGYYLIFTPEINNHIVIYAENE